MLGVNIYKMESILKFIYLGQVEIAEGYIDDFLKIASDLKVRTSTFGIPMQDKREG